MSIVSVRTALVSPDQSATRPRSAADIEWARQAIEAWYLDRIEVCPGNTGAGGISFALPESTQDLALTIMLDGEPYIFHLHYDRHPGAADRVLHWCGTAGRDEIGGSSSCSTGEKVLATCLRS